MPRRVTEAAAVIDPDVGLSPDVLGNRHSSYRDFISGPTLRDLPSYSQERMIRLAWKLYETNALANRLTDVTIDFLLGDGLTFRAVHEDVQAGLEAFWDDAVNMLEQRQFEFLRALSLTGELCLPFALTPETGTLELGYIDPLQIAAVELDPGNALVTRAVRLKTPPGAPVQRLPVPTIDRTTGRWTLMERATNVQADGCFFLKINAPPHASRGRSDLLPAFNWLVLHDEFIYKVANAAVAHRSLMWHVVLKNKSQSQVEEWKRSNALPGTSGVTHAVTNDNVSFNPVAPTDAATDADELARLVRLVATLPSSIPEAWLYSAADANRATTAEQSLPTLRHFSRRQKEIKGFWEQVLLFVRDQLPGIDALSTDERRITVSLPPVSPDDSRTTASTLKDLTAALVVAEDRGYASIEEAAKLWRHQASQGGVELPPAPNLGTLAAARQPERWSPYTPAPAGGNGASAD